MVGPGGEPVSRVEVRLLGAAEEIGAHWPFLTTPRDLQEASLPDGFVTRTHAKTDGEGRFRLVGTQEVAAPALTVRADEHVLPRPVAFEPGQVGLVLRLEAAGALHLRWLEPEDASGKGAKVILRDDHGRVVRGKLDPAILSHDDLRKHVFEKGQGGARLRGLLPGSYTVEFRWAQFEDRIGPVHEVDVVSGEISRPPVVDLRPHLRRIPVHVADVDGRRVDAPVLRFYGARNHAELPQSDGAVIVPRNAVFDLIVAAPGFRPKVVEDLLGPARVTLERGFDVTLKLAAPFPDRDAPGHPHLAVTALGIEYVADSRSRLRVPARTASPHVAVELGNQRESGTVLFLTDEEGVPVADEYPLTFVCEGTYLLRWIGFCARHTRVEAHSLLTITEADAGGVVELEVPPEIRELWE